MLCEKFMSDSNLVYVTGVGRICPDCRKPSQHCRCRPGKKTSVQPQHSKTKVDGIIRVGRETKGRKGKGVTLIMGLPLQEEALKEFARILKQRCGSGGTVHDGAIEIQGDHREELVTFLQDKGYTVKKSGG